jgi:hypothetical protein
MTIAAEPNVILQATGVKPNDPVFTIQAGQLLPMHADMAWAITTGLRNDMGPPPLIAVIDTGIDYTHEDLAAKSWSAPQAYTVSANGTTISCPAGSHGFNWINDTCDPLDDNGHGTFVAGIAAADSNNGVGITGISWASPVLAEKAGP